MQCYIFEFLRENDYKNNIDKIKCIILLIEGLFFVVYTDFLLTSYIGQYCADKKSVELLAIRYALTNNITYAHYSVRLDLHKYALFNSPILLEMLMKFANMHCDTDDVFGSEVSVYYRVNTILVRFVVTPNIIIQLN